MTGLYPLRAVKPFRKAVVLHVEAEARDSTFAVLADMVRLWLVYGDESSPAS
jgi:hypothetical protein